MKTLGVILAVAFSLLTSVAVAQELVSSIHLGSRYEKIVERDGYWYMVGQWGLECWRFDEYKQFDKLSEVSTPGIAQWVALEGNYAYVADGWEGLSIVDVSDPHRLTLVSNFLPQPISYGALPGYFEHVAVKGTTAYLTGRYGIAVIDVSAPLTPVQLNRIYFADTLYGVVMDESNRAGMAVFSDSTMFVAFSGTPNWDRHPPGIYQFDISDPQAIRLERTYEAMTYEAKLLAIRDSALFVAGSWEFRAFLITEDSLAAKDSLSDMTMISQLGNPEDISLSGNTILLAGTGGKNSGGIANISVANLDSVYYVEIYETPVHFNCVSLVDSTALAGYFHWDLEEMKLLPDGMLDSVGFTKSEGNVEGVALYADHLFVGDISNGVLIYDVADRRKPWFVGTIPLEAPLAPTILGDHLFVSSVNSGTLVYDVRAPYDPILIDSLPASKRSAFCKSGNLVFVGSDELVEIFDFSTEILRLVSSSTAGGGGRLMVRDSLLYSVGQVARINADTTLTSVAAIGGDAMGVFDVVDSFYFATRGLYGLHVFNIADPRMPVFVTYWDTFTYANEPGNGNDLRVLGNTAILLDGDWGITEVDITDPVQPHFIERVATPGIAVRMCFDERYLYVADVLGVSIFSHDFSTETDEVNPRLPNSLTLYQNYPNPFNSGTVIEYDLARVTEVDLSIINILGQKIRTIRLDRQNAGRHFFYWNGTADDGKEVASGFYLFQAVADGTVITKKMILLK
jgi:hypothetical protein